MKLNTVIKITALAVIAAFAAMSCAPEVELTGIDWKAVNDGSNSAKNSTAEGTQTPRFNAGAFSVDVWNPPVTVHTEGVWNPTGTLSSSSFEASESTPLKNQIRVTFPADSDFLRRNLEGANLLKALQEFLSFHNYTNPKNDNEAFSHIGKATTLSDPLVYELDETYIRDENRIYLKFPSKPANTSGVIMKIDATKYTYDNGNKMDIFENGIPGEAIYDDYWLLIGNAPSAPSTADFTFPTNFSAKPGARSWTVTLGAVTTSQGIAETATLDRNDIVIATLSLTGIDNLPTAVPGDSVTKDVAEGIYKAVADQLIASGAFKVQTYDIANKKWNDAAGTIEYHGGANTANRKKGNFYLGSFTLKDLEPVRVVWEGNNNKPIKTTEEYFGVQQWISIRDTATSDASVKAKHEYGRQKVYGSVANIWTTATAYDRFGLGTTHISVTPYSMDTSKRNVIIDITFEPKSTGGSFFWLIDYPDTQVIIDNFKIAYYTGTEAGSFEDRRDVAYIPIKSITLEKKGKEAGLNTMRVKLDPGYKLNSGGGKVFYISPEIKYTDKSSFGIGSNWQNNFWGAYAVSGF